MAPGSNSQGKRQIELRGDDDDGADDAFDDELDVKGPPRVLLCGPAT